MTVGFEVAPGIHHGERGGELGIDAARFQDELAHTPVELIGLLAQTVLDDLADHEIIVVEQMFDYNLLSEVCCGRRRQQAPLLRMMGQHEPCEGDVTGLHVFAVLARKGTMSEVDGGTLFMRAMAIEAAHAPVHLRHGLEHGVLTPRLASFVEGLAAEDPERLDELAEFVALTTARGRPL